MGKNPQYKLQFKKRDRDQKPCWYPARLEWQQYKSHLRPAKLEILKAAYDYVRVANPDLHKVI